MNTKNIILKIAIAVMALAGILILGQQYLPVQTSQKAGHHDLYYCPMHPQIMYDHPGRCPICGMDLVKKIEATQEKESSVEGYAAISENPQRQQLAGVKTVKVNKGLLVRTIRAAGQYEGEIFAQVFESDLVLIKVGQKAIVEIPAYHQKYIGAVNSIDSMIDPVSRTIRIRIWLKENHQKKFKTNMFVNVELPITLGQALIVPREAVMDTGMRKMVFVQTNESTFMPREIQTGVETDDGFEVRSGLTEGDRIVLGGNFLLDSESRVQAGLEQGGSHG